MTYPYRVSVAAPFDTKAASTPCSNCGQTHMRLLRDDSDALETLCLCGRRKYMEESGVFDATWSTDSIMRLITIDQAYMPHMHVFREGENGQSISEQVGTFILSAEKPFRALLPMDAYKGRVDPPSADTLALAENAFKDTSKPLRVCHHFAPSLRVLNTSDYEHHMVAKGEQPYDHLDHDDQTRIAQLRGFSTYDAFAQWQQSRM